MAFLRSPFAGDPPPGDYEVYASLYSDCGQSTVNFGLSLFTRLEGEVDEAGGWPVERTDIALGLLQSQVAKPEPPRDTRTAGLGIAGAPGLGGAPAGTVDMNASVEDDIRRSIEQIRGRA